ncbi:MAG: hypothetical protein PHI12_07550 [Dehalococcoidales bacterium]|nr:hypothetical protein [Dehalococcoidales bacterium]
MKNSYHAKVKGKGKFRPGTQGKKDKSGFRPQRAIPLEKRRPGMRFEP